MPNNQASVVDIAKILNRAIQEIEPALQPIFIAGLERLAARRYRIWADDHSDTAIKHGLLACAGREEEISARVESLHPNASGIQDKLLWSNAEVLELNRTLFEGRPIEEQFRIQANGERAGAAVWRSYAAAATDPSAREVLLGCSPLEEANAEFLESLL